MSKSRRERMEKGIFYINGEYCSGIDAKIPVYDAGFGYGANTYDMVTLCNGFLIKLDSHVRRFYEGLHTLNFKLSLSKEEFKEVIFETVRRNRLKDGVISEACTYGPFHFEVMGEEIGPPDREATLIVACHPSSAQSQREEVQKIGLKARITKIKDYPVQCIEARVKNYDRLNYYLARMELRGTDATMALLTDMDGYLTQGTGENLWVIRDSKLFTPGGNVLYGITREAVFDIAKLENIEAMETRLTPHQIYNADEVFVCSSRPGGLFPIIEVDKRKIGDGQPGSITKYLIDAFRKMHVDPKYATKVPGLE